MSENDVNETEATTPSRRRFLQAAAATGAAGAVWSAPIIRGIPAYAADAASVTGSLPNQFISWSPMRDNWDDNTSGNINQSPSRGMDNCGGQGNYMVSGGSLSNPLTLTAVGNPGGSANCFALSGTYTSLISLESQTGCMFSSFGYGGECNVAQHVFADWVVRNLGVHNGGSDA
jgi:hypothetical protein